MVGGIQMNCIIRLLERFKTHHNGFIPKLQRCTRLVTTTACITFSIEFILSSTIIKIKIKKKKTNKQESKNENSTRDMIKGACF